MSTNIKRTIAIVLITVLMLSVIPFSSFASAEENTDKLSLGETYSVKLSAGEVKCISFKLTKAAKFKLKTVLISTAAEGVLNYQLYYGEKNIAGVNGRWTEASGRFSYSFDEKYLNSGEYQFYVYSDLKCTIKIYTSKVDLKESFPETNEKADNSINEANAIELNRKYYGVFTEVDSLDVYKFTLDKDSNINFVLNAYADTIYLSYYIYNSNSKKIATKNLPVEMKSWHGYKATDPISYTNSHHLKKGTYYLAIDASFPTDYNIKISSTHIHVSKTKTTKATTSSNGELKTYCTDCGETISRKVINKISSIKLSATKYMYNGKTITPTVTVKDSKGKMLKNGTDYTAKYSSGRKNPGQYTVTVTFKGNYSGTKKLSFTIVPGTPTLSVTTAAKKALLKWNKQTGATGYEVYMSTSKSGKYSKIATLKGNSKISYTKTGLTKGKTYYFKVAAYKTVDGKNIYGASSAVKSAKIK